MIEEEITKLKEEIFSIKERNFKVEADKAWETSNIRVIFITIITYIVATIVLYFIGAKNFLLNALVPSIGFLLSVQTLPAIKKWWIKKSLIKKEK